MKKFAAIFISVMLIALMAIAPTVSAVAAQDFKAVYQENGSLTLEKYQSGSNKKTAVEGATFTAYRVFDLNKDGIFSVNENLFSGAVKTALENELNDGAISFKSTSVLEDMIPTLQTAVKNESASPAKGIFDSVANGGIYKFAQLPLGVYLVVETKVPTNYAVSSVPFLVSIPQWIESEKENEDGKWEFDVTAYPKDDKVTLDKYITNSDDVSPLKDVTTATKDIGDEVDYKIETKIPYYGESFVNESGAATKNITYTFVDEMSKGLTYNGDFEATVLVPDLEADEQPAYKKVKLAKDAYTAGSETTENGTTITVKFNWAKIDQYQGYGIVFEYTAILNENAEIGSANENSAQLFYTNDPRPNSSADGSDLPSYEDEKEREKLGKTPKSKTQVYTYAMDLTKTFNNKAPKDAGVTSPSDVEFTLTKDGEKTPLQFVELSVGSYVALGDKFKATVNNGKITLSGKTYSVVSKISPDSNGNLEVKGLDEATYVLSEVSSVKGWSKLASDITITLTGDKDEDGKYISGKLTKAEASPNLTLEVNTKGNATATGHFGITVNNVKKQFDLPLTGGMGLLMFTIGGGIVIAGAIILFSTLRKKKTAE
ncbi:MAG: SpaH/EbpB family LPXTG-anchored major pilin [Ruminococcus sp.]|nr:SpaH/EbpB family LPXTG-anchored major pilin [Ruminococcus sp.]